MIFEYTPETDTLYIQFKKNKNVEGVDLNNRTVAFYTDKNEISALEIEHARKVVDLKSVQINGKLFAFPKITSSKKKLKK